MARRLRLSLLFATLGACWAFPVYAQKVTPSERVRTHVNVRENPSTSAAIIGEMAPGIEVDLLESVPRWYKVRLADGVEGYVSKSWTVVFHLPLGTAFQVHFLDVGTGDSAILDLGSTEIVIDGGDSPTILSNYAARTGIIDDPIELLVITHPDSDHWKGIPRLLGLNDGTANPTTVLEIWEPGYNRDCQSATNSARQSYLDFISELEDLPGVEFRRPLEEFHLPTTATGVVDTLQPLPGLSVIVLHTDQSPQGSSCSYRINNASIVLKIDIDGVRFLFTGDANGKEREEPSPGTPGHVEAQLLALEEHFPGLLRSDVLKVPHHGSETASTQAFIDAVDPHFVIISASTRHHLPRSTVVDRYTNEERIILRTDDNLESDRDHIVCFRKNDDLTCNYEDVPVE